MRRRIVQGLLVAGVVLGFGSGFYHLRHGRHGCHGHRDRVMQEFAAECARAARSQEAPPRSPPPDSR